MAGARLTLALAAAFVAAGLGVDSPSLLVPGAALALLGVGAVAWVEAAARTARVDRSTGPPTVVEQEPYPLRIRVKRGLVPLSGELADPLLERPLRVGAVVGRAATQVSVPVRFSRRGRHRLEPAVLTLRDPLGLHAREVRGGGGGELLVLPRVEPVLAPGEGAGAGERPAAQLGDASGAAIETRAIDFEVDGLRPYREGSPASRIHWPAVARTGELIERRLVAGGDRTPLVALDAEPPDPVRLGAGAGDAAPDPVRPRGGARGAGDARDGEAGRDDPDGDRESFEDALDAAVRAAASLCVHLARVAGGCALLLPGERRPHAIDSELRSWPAAHARLAVVAAGDGVPAVARAGHTGAILWVSARGGRPPRSATRGGVAVSHLVSPRPLPGVPVRFTVAGCHGQALRGAARRPTAAGERAA